MKSGNNLSRLLYALSILLNKEQDLRHLYFTALPILMLGFGFEKGVIFKYSNRKQCFDPKAGIKSEYVKDIFDRWAFLSESDFAAYLEEFDVNLLYDTDFNRKIRDINMPCNDISRSLINSFITKHIKLIEAKLIKNRHIVYVLEQMEMENAIYIPLCSMDEVVGFVLASPIADNKDDILPFAAMLGLAIDNLVNAKEISHLKEFIDTNKNELIHKQKLYEIGKTASTITHEFKNSLVGIIGLFNKLKNHVDKTDKANRYIDIIDSELSKLYGFALDINKYSKSSTTNKEMLDLGDVVDKAIELTTSLNSNFVFSVCIDKKASKIYADRIQIEQVLINLFKNAIEAYKGKTGGEIRVLARRAGDFILIKIRDNSGGVSKDKLDEISKPFYTTKPYGTGLGLSIVSEIIKEHNGTVEFKNIKDGLECDIRLPIPKNTLSEAKDG
jgi:signal transduction histidine kinase